jgi:hypothetical protein
VNVGEHHHHPPGAIDAHSHPHACDCTSHRIRSASSHGRTGIWSVLLPILACSICPACLTTYAKVLSVFGVGIGLDSRVHDALMVVAISASILLSGWRTFRSRRVWPLAVAVTGATLIVAGHLDANLHTLEWMGVAFLLVGGLVEHFRLRINRTVTATTHYESVQASQRP